MYRCPNQHQSETSDFCSVCGTEIAPPPPPAPATPEPPPAALVPSGEPCPDCGTPRTRSTQIFCEVCGRNFQTGKAGIPPAKPVEETQEARPAAPSRWDVTVSVAADLYGEINPDAPVGDPPQVFTLFEAENLIGRATPGIRLQIPVHHDPGVSRRQAIVLRKPDNNLFIRDLGSANGTRLNDRELVPGVETRLKHGDAVAVGAWTRIIFAAVATADK